uniref:Paxillin homolog 1 (Trinotate prediction) n=1 Tax=Henneguya salminicola TaxID=69463 RepID=A0A6G3MKL2_HENSL
MKDSNKFDYTQKKTLTFDPLEGPPYKCAGCFEVIDDEICKTHASIWHPKHFTCTVCNKSLIDEPFYEIDYELYCQVDYELKFLQKCKVCHDYIYEEWIEIGGLYYHPEHFTCAECKVSLSDVAYYQHEKLPYCENCFTLNYAPSCAGCGKPVVIDFMNALNSTWHTSCFCCKRSEMWYAL